MPTAAGRLLVAVLATAVVVGAGARGAEQPASKSAPAYLLLELPSGRVVVESGRRILDTPVAPGSIAKLATLAAALESGATGEATRIMCRRRADVDGRTIECVHPDLKRPLDAAEALGHSCNVYFATVARTLGRGALNEMFVRLGLSPLDSGTPTVTGALGLGGIRATPRQLVEAFLRIAGSSETSITLDDRHRAVLRRGMELAARSGTASALAEAGFSGLAKTGTAPMPGGGYEGIVTALVNTERPTHAIIVVAPGASGAHAAQLAAGFLTKQGVPSRQPGPLRVGVAQRDGSYVVDEVDLETYVGRAVAGEGGDALPPAALEALAIAARTFAAANRGRHAAGGFDVCDLTHCMALRATSPASRAAAAATRGLLLFDGSRVADLYLSASCGGYTERPSLVWAGAQDPPYLPSKPDPACKGEPDWTSDVPEPQVRQALQVAGLRGGPIRDLSVVARSSSGRARHLRVDGMVPEVVDAGAFRLAAGRVLGWQTIKSTLFAIRRTGVGYRFTGRGLGHGVGLCVRGAEARAAAGDSRDSILAFYFPGLRIGSASADVRIVLPEADRQSLSTLRDRVSAALSDLSGKLGVGEPADLEVRFHPTVEAYVRATGQPWWTSARTAGLRIDVLPLDILRKRGTLDRTIRHELVHVLTENALRNRPLWVREGLAQVMAGQTPPTVTAGDVAPCPSDRELRSMTSAEAWRDAYARAARCVTAALAKGRTWMDVR